jgi:hypothetical protein
MRILEEVTADEGALREAFWIEHYSGEEAQLLNVSAALPIQRYRPPAPARPPAGTRTPGTIKQWTVRLSQPLIEAVKAQTTTEGKEPSHLVEELLWYALTDRRSLTP